MPPFKYQSPPGQTPSFCLNCGSAVTNPGSSSSLRKTCFIKTPQHKCRPSRGDAAKLRLSGGTSAETWSRNVPHQRPSRSPAWALKRTTKHFICGLCLLKPSFVSVGCPDDLGGLRCCAVSVTSPFGVQLGPFVASHHPSFPVSLLPSKPEENGASPTETFSLFNTYWTNRK